jgi:two-component system nitrogen regulation sensor histidine kinase GlnL
VECIVTPFSTEAGRFVLVEMVEVNRQQHIQNGEQVLIQHETVHALMRGLAHEIRNPLGGLRGAAQLLERELSDPELEEYTRVIIGEADRLQKLLDRLLGPRTVPKTRPVNIHEITERLCKLVKAESPEGVSLVCDYDPSIPEFDADPDLLIQALLNVVRNAAQAVGEQGTITLRTRSERQVTLGGQHHRLALRLDIMDDGPGIPPDMLDKMFYPMVSGRTDGTGLGLSIAQNLIHQHGGLIQCTSRPGQTVMSTWLPLERYG